jgi:hypothetical protein
MREINTDLIPKRKGKATCITGNGFIEDIIDTILYADSLEDGSMNKFSTNFTKDKEGLEKLWKFVREEILYEADTFSKQYIKLPGALWDSKTGDSKSKTLFVNAVLKALGVKYKYKLVGYSDNPTVFTHVYTIAYLQNGKEIAIDTSIADFNSERPFAALKYIWPHDFDVEKFILEKISKK